MPIRGKGVGSASAIETDDGEYEIAVASVVEKV